MSREQVAELWKEYRQRQAIQRKGPANRSAEALAEWNKGEEALEAFKKQIEALEDE
jgi:hypothetical protein